MAILKQLHSIFISYLQQHANVYSFLASRSRDVYLLSDLGTNKSARSVFIVGRSMAVCGGLFQQEQGPRLRQNREDSTQ
jgi:hypothetical protein